MALLKIYGPKWLGISRFFPYPLRATRITFDLNIFGFWWPVARWNKELTERAKEEGVVYGTYDSPGSRLVIVDGVDYKI